MIEPIPSSLTATLRNAELELLRRRTNDGHWEGDLSSSALSTATAVFALHLVARNSSRTDDRLSPLIRAGIGWLVRNQNSDGGWGDTDVSLSNISTTALCWAAISAAGHEARDAVARAEQWLAGAAGNLSPQRLAAAITARYGNDRTFSVPILTMCALAGRLGPEPDAWKLVTPLPFELAACPRKWFAALRLPVVSYALPALIAMGLVRYHHLSPRNPASRVLRRAVRGRVLEVLRDIQPTEGGFLEATPLTSFVTMSLAACGLADHPVARDGAEFLIRSVRPDGSWPIDTNLATWITTLAVNALATVDGLTDVLSADDRNRILAWLLNQQYRTVHPYTRAAPGGWAWTDLPGGVPDADDTAGVLLALFHLGAGNPEGLQSASAGIEWLLGLQNRDGGIPTFCRGWGALPFDRSGCDLTAHALHAWCVWQPLLPTALRRRVDNAIDRAIGFLAENQRPDGTWIPLWFGNQHAGEDSNPVFGTARVLVALNAMGKTHPRVNAVGIRARDWLLQSQAADGGWGGDAGLISTIEETSLAVRALVSFRDHRLGTRESVARGILWIGDRTNGGRDFPPAPIGFYFAKLWYFEREYPLVFAVGALRAALADFSKD